MLLGQYVSANKLLVSFFYSVLVWALQEGDPKMRRAMQEVH